MTWSNRVVWLEGMFLRAQHFQQQDRWFETQLRDRTAALRSHAWGLTEGAINRSLLTTGQFALATGSGIFEDGTPFSLPGEVDQPAPLDLTESTRNAVVYLALPIRQAGAIVADPVVRPRAAGAALARVLPVHQRQVVDAHVAGGAAVQVRFLGHSHQ